MLINNCHKKAPLLIQRQEPHSLITKQTTHRYFGRCLNEIQKTIKKRLLNNAGVAAKKIITKLLIRCIPVGETPTREDSGLGRHRSGKKNKRSQHLLRPFAHFNKLYRDYF